MDTAHRITLEIRRRCRRLWRVVPALLGAGPRWRRTNTIYVTKVDHPGVFVGGLFERTFGDPIPETPVHYVAFRQTLTGAFVAVGYYHVSYCGAYALVGGLCVEGSERGRGVGELLERYVYRDAGSTLAYFAYVGDPTRASRVGFSPTAYPHLMAYWVRPADSRVRAQLEEEVARLGAF